MRILIVNDDSIYSPGIALLAKVAAKFGEVLIVAPSAEQSSTGHAITASRPLTYRRTAVPGGFEAYRVDGTPADCVALGAYIWQRVDIVLSGVNMGSNLGNSAWHSGTLAAAKQAALLDIRGVALSAPAGRDDESLESLAPFVGRVLSLLLEHDDLSLVNVNFPENPRGIHWTRQSVRHYDGSVVAAKDPQGRPVYWFTVVPLEPAEEGTDRWAVENGFVSMTPLRLDLTDKERLEKLQQTKLPW